MLAAILVVSFLVGVGTEVLLLARWASGVCGEWAQPSSITDPRCDGTLDVVRHRAYPIAKWSGGAFCVALIWLLESRKRAARRTAV